MQKIILALILFFVLWVPSYSQEPVKIFFPLILKGTEMPTIIEKWKVVSPVESTNYTLNPSGETTGNYSALGTATVTRSTTYQKFGNYSYRVQTGSNGAGISLTLSTLPNEACFATARIRGQLPIDTRFIIGTGLSTPLLIEKIDNFWNLYGVFFSAASCSGRTELRIIQQGNGIGDFYVDGVQVENNEFWTSYIDGDQEGCAWNGPEHAATSTRSGKSRAGGQVKGLYSDYGFLVEKVIGAGATTRSLEIDEYALLPGGELNEIKIQQRDWSLIGKFIADSDDEIFQNRQGLLKLLRKNPQKQPTKFLFYHPKGIREIKSFYSAGLESDMSVFYDSWITEDDNKWAELNKYIEKDTIQLKSPDPYFYGQGNKSISVDTNDSATFRYVAGRLKATDQWSVLGPPGAGGTYNSVRALAEDATYLYIGGSFSNWDAIANADAIVRYNKSTGVYSAMGTGASGGSQTVFALTKMPNGDIIAAGNFTSMGGIANTTNIARWDIVGQTWNALKSGSNATISALTVGLDGILYAGGIFSSIGATPVNNIAQWNGLSWSVLGTGTNAGVETLATHLDGTIYAGGGFTTAGGNTVNGVARWDGSTWSALGTGVNTADVTTIAIGLNGIVYVGGSFASAGGVTAANVASWNGSSWSNLGNGTDTRVTALAVGADGVVYVGGTVLGASDEEDNVRKWNGFAWSHLDVDLPGDPVVYDILASKYTDPVLIQKYDIFLGFDTTGTGNFAGLNSANNEGSVDVFPKISFRRIGGTDIALRTFRNESNAKELLFDYVLLDGEKLTIDLTPTKKSIVSNVFGSRMGAILPNCDFGSFILETGTNEITSFAIDQFALYPSSLESFMIWSEVYESYD